MKAKIRKGHEILHTEGYSNKWDNDHFTHWTGPRMIINFMNKYSYVSFKQKKNHLLIDTTEGEIDIVFTGETPKLEFDSYCKDQLILKLIKE